MTQSQLANSFEAYVMGTNCGPTVISSVAVDRIDRIREALGCIFSSFQRRVSFGDKFAKVVNADFARGAIIVGMATVRTIFHTHLGAPVTAPISWAVPKILASFNSFCVLIKHDECQENCKLLKTI